MKKERVEKWDNLKFILIYLVVLGHLVDPFTGTRLCMQKIFSWIYAFHMPAFIFVTGMLGKRNVQEKRYPQIASYLVMYIATQMISCLSGFIGTGEVKFELFKSMIFPWYAFAVFVYYLVTIAVRRLKKRYVFLFAVVLACFAGYDSSLGDFLFLSRLVVFYPFFYAGYCMQPERLWEIAGRKNIRVLSATVFAVFTGCVLLFHDKLYRYRGMLTGRNSFEIVLKTDYAYAGWIRLIYYILAFVLAFALISLTPNRRTAFTWIGKNTLSVYMLHYFFIDLLDGRIQMAAVTQDISGGILVPSLVVLALLITFICGNPLFEKLCRKFVMVTEHIES